MLETVFTTELTTRSLWSAIKDGLTLVQDRGVQSLKIEEHWVAMLQVYEKLFNSRRVILGPLGH